MIRKIFIFVVAALVFVGCVHNRFDRVENTPVSRYDIVYDDDKCGVFDNEADSLVTSMEYDSLHFMRSALEDSITIVIFGCSKNNREGLLAVMEPNNEIMELLFPEEFNN